MMISNKKFSWETLHPLMATPRFVSGSLLHQENVSHHIKQNTQEWLEEHDEKLGLGLQILIQSSLHEMQWNHRQNSSPTPMSREPNDPLPMSQCHAPQDPSGVLIHQNYSVIREAATLKPLNCCCLLLSLL